ncbi:MAG: SurA N-terminal domain-containing protein [Desulfocapsa sp.]|nr:SurA N-terminal domain-containing protein [Desulfocapsa sp.]
MLQIFRDKSQSMFIQAVVLVIALVFIFWGVGANMMDSREAAIVVNDEEISFQEYQRTYDQLLSTYRQQFGGSVPEALLENLGLTAQVKTQLIQQALLRQGASSMGLLVSEPEVQRDIKEMVQFQEDGAFDIEKYKTILSSNRMTPHKFEASMRYNTLSSKGVTAIGNFSTTVTDAEINDLFQQAKESISLRFIKIVPTEFTDKVTIEEEALAAWFDQNKENYKSDPKLKLKFLSFPYTSDSETTEVGDEPMRAAVFQKANEAYENIISAGSLQEYAKLHPEAVILETDFFSRNNPPANLDNAPSVRNTAFSLKAGELSSLIESPAGYSILYAEAIQEPDVPPLESVREPVTADYKAQQAKKLAREKSDEILAALKGDADFSELAQTEGIEIKTATLSRGSMGSESNGFPPSLLKDVFALNSSAPLPEEPATVGDDLYIYQLTERSLPDLASITEEEKEQYRTQIINEKQDRLLLAWIRNQEKNADIYSHKNLK